MLETIREFGLEQLGESGESERLGRAHGTYFANVAEEAEPHLASGDRGRWLSRLMADQDNLRAALRWALERDEAEVGLRILGALWLWYWLSFREGRRWATALLALPSAAPPTLTRARALVTAATSAWGEGESAAVHALGAEAVRIARAHDEPRLIAHALMAYGASNLHDVAEVGEIFRDCHAQATRAGAPWWIAFAQLCHAIVAAQLGQAEVARAQSLAATARFEELNDPFFAAIARLQCGVALFELGDHGGARSHLEACLPPLRAMRDRKFTLVALIALGHAIRIDGDAAAAAGPYAEALVLCRDAGALGDLPLCFEGLAAAGLAAGEAPVAARLLGAAQAARLTGFAPTVPGYERMYEETAAAGARALGDAAFGSAWSAGHALPIAQAIAAAQDLAERAAAPAAAAPSATGHPGGLTEREIEVLALLAAGESNRAIADRLSLSVRTVEKHIAHIYDKIDARGRADAALFAARHGLVADAP